MSDHRFSFLGDIKPLNKRVAAIRHEACKFSFYNQKYITVSDETSSAKKYLQNDVLGPVILLIKRAVFYTYMDYRSAASFVSFFHSLYHDVITPVGQSQIKLWFLQAIRNQESRHYTEHEELSGLQERAGAGRLIDMIQGILDYKLADDMDCATFFTSATLKALDIIPCQARFDRRIKRMQNSPLFKNETYETAKVTRLFILATMDLDNKDHDYATIPLDRLSEFEHLFRSNIDCNSNTMSIMLDLFMDEIEYNHVFWIQLIKQCQNLVPEENNDASQNCTIQSAFGYLVGLKLESFYNTVSPEKEELVDTLFYASALLIKENLISMRHLAQYIDFNSDGYGVRLLAALFSVGDLDAVLAILQDRENSVDMDETFYSRVHLAVDTLMDSWLEKTDFPTSTLPQQQQHRPTKFSKALVDGTQRTGYYFDSDTDSDTDTEKEDNESNSTSNSTFSSIHSRKNIGELGSAGFVAPKLYKLFSGNWKSHLNDSNASVKTQLVSKFIIPCFKILGPDRMINASTTLNKFIIVLQSALSIEENDSRTPLLQMIHGFVLPALATNPSIDVYSCMIAALTDAERLHCYLSWRDDGVTKLQIQQRIKAKQDFMMVLDNSELNRHHIGKNALTLLRSHPTEIADLVIHEMQFDYNMTLSKRQFIGDLYTHSSSKLALDILAAQIADKIASTRSMNFDQKENKPRTYKLPESIELLCVFARHLFKDRQVLSTPLYQYLSLYLNRQLITPNQQRSSLPWFFTASFIQFVCARTNEYSHQKNNHKRKVNLPITINPSKKRPFRPLGDSHNNKKRCL